MESLQLVFDWIVVLINGFSVAPMYIKAGFAIVLIFFLIISLAQIRHHFVRWSFKGGLIGLFFGALLTLIVEGFFMINGSTILITLLGWQKAPKPIKTALDLGKERISNVLGIQTQTEGEESIMSLLQNLDPDEIKKIKAIMCTP